MNYLRNFEEFLKEGVARKQTQDKSRASSLTQEASERNDFIKDMDKAFGITDKKAKRQQEEIKLKK